MSFKNFLAFLLFFCFFLITKSSHSQQSASSFKLFFEKVYLHTDRSWYASGDDIWYKAYLVNGQSNYITSTSNNLYVELIDPKGQITLREVIRLENGTGAGDFRLKDSLPGGAYKIRAYTNWMRNFGDHFVFEKDIQVKNMTGSDPASGVRQTSINSNKKHTTDAGYKIQFFPEGGTLVEGVKTIVAFKAEDVAGNGVNASGSIISSKNDTVAKFTTTHLGMGKFEMKPMAGLSYNAVVKFASGQYTTANFPAVLADGFVMNINNDDSASINVNIFSNPATIARHGAGILTVAAKHAGKVIFSQKVSFKDGNPFVIIPKNDFPPGIASVTLYDENLHPYCERLVYIENNNPVTLAVSTDKDVYQGKERTTINISATDAAQHPVKAVLSLAAVDERMDKDLSENILSYLMLQSELKGKIENASAYFDIKNPNYFQHLDLLLLTQGWRSFLWRQMADTSIHISYIPEAGITVSGQVKTLFGDKPLPDMNITVMAPGAKGDKLLSAKTDAKGKFFVDGLGLYGTQTIKVNSKNDKSKKGGLLTLDTLFGHPIPAGPVNDVTDTSGAFNYFAAESVKRSGNNKNTDWYNILPNVTVTNKRSTVVLRDGNAYMNFGYPEYDFTITQKDDQYKTLQEFLVQKVPGAVYDVEKEGINFIANGKPVRPRIIVAKREDVFERIDYYTLPMNQVISVSVRHLVGHPTFNRTTNANGRMDLGVNNTDVFIIYLELKPGAFNTDLAYINTEVEGYYEARLFYSPNYASHPDKSKPDTRTTIYWDSYITTDENGKATISYFNADPKTTIRLDVQGVSDKGVPLFETNKYTIK